MYYSYLTAYPYKESASILFISMLGWNSTSAFVTGRRFGIILENVFFNGSGDHEMFLLEKVWIITWSRSLEYWSILWLPMSISSVIRLSNFKGFTYGMLIVSVRMSQQLLGIMTVWELSDTLTDFCRSACIFVFPMNALYCASSFIIEFNLSTNFLVPIFAQFTITCKDPVTIMSHPFTSCLCTL